MLFSPAEILSILEHYKYLVIFPIAVIEGPIIIIISGFLVSLGFLNGLVAYSVLVVADVIGDTLYYLIGKYWRSSTRIKKYAKFIGFDERSEVFLEEHFRKHKIKTFLIAKISHGMGWSVWISAGIARIKYLELVFYSLMGTLIKTSVLLLLGYYIGKSYVEINSYLHYIALFTITLALIIFLFFITKRLSKNFFNKKDDIAK